MYVVPPNNTWPINRRGDPMYVIPRSLSLVRVHDEGASLFNIPVVTPQGAWGSDFNVRGPALAIQPVWAQRLGAEVGSAMARCMDSMILAYFMIPPGNPEELARMFEAMGIAAPYNIGVGMSAGTLLAEAKTLRQRCFARLFNGFDEKTGLIRMSYAGYTGVKIRPFANTLRSLMPACYRNKKLRKSLASISISMRANRSNGNAELVEPLQDLANIIAYEIRLAYEDDYYPGMPDVDSMTEEHVDQVMVAMQREVDREQRYVDDHSRYKVTVKLPDLPRERKTALAERRRHWFGVFGITPRSWKTGKWSLWKVANIPYPDGYKIPVW